MIIFFPGNLNKALATSPRDLEDHSGVFWHELMNVWSSYLAMVMQDIQDMLHRCQICIEIRGGYVIDVRCIKGPTAKIIIQIITKANFGTLAKLKSSFPKPDKSTFEEN